MPNHQQENSLLQQETSYMESSTIGKSRKRPHPASTVTSQHHNRSHNQLLQQQQQQHHSHDNIATAAAGKNSPQHIRAQQQQNRPHHHNESPPTIHHLTQCLWNVSYRHHFKSYNATGQTNSNTTTSTASNQASASPISSNQQHAIPGRWCHSCGYYKGHLLVFGGMLTEENSRTNECYLYHIQNATWIHRSLATHGDSNNERSYPDHSTAHTLTIFEEFDEAILLGGSSTPFSEIFVLNLKEWKWERRKTTSKYKVYIKDDLLVNERLIEDHKITSSNSRVRSTDHKKQHLDASPSSRQNDKSSSQTTPPAATGTPPTASPPDNAAPSESPAPTDTSSNVPPSPKSRQGPNVSPLDTTTSLDPHTSESNPPSPSPEPFMGTHSVDVMDTGFGTSSERAQLNDRISVVTKTVYPTPRSQHSAVRYNNWIIVFGGAGPRSEEQKFDDLWIFDRESNEWEKPKTLGRKPERRWGHDAVRIGDSMYMFGGVIKSGVTGAQHMTNELFRYNILTRYWSQIDLPASSPSPAPRAAHTLSAYGDKLVILWGGDNSKYLNDMCVIDTSSLQARRIVFSTPGPRCSHTTVAVGNFLFVFGGCDMQTGHPRVYRELYAVSMRCALQMVGMTVHPALLRDSSSRSDLMAHHDLQGGHKQSLASPSSPATPKTPNSATFIRRDRFPQPNPGAFLNIQVNQKIDNEKTKHEEKRSVTSRIQQLARSKENALSREQQQQHTQTASSNGAPAPATAGLNQGHHAASSQQHHHKIESQLYVNMQAKAITNWLVSLGLGRYAALFIREEIEMEVLHTLTEQDLLLLGVDKMGPRKKIMYAASKLKGPPAREPQVSPQNYERQQHETRVLLDSINQNTSSLISVTANLNKTVEMMNGIYSRMLYPSAMGNMMPAQTSVPSPPPTPSHSIPSTHAASGNPSQAPPPPPLPSSHSHQQHHAGRNGSARRKRLLPRSAMTRGNYNGKPANGYHSKSPERRSVGHSPHKQHQQQRHSVPSRQQDTNESNSSMKAKTSPSVSSTTEKVDMQDLVNSIPGCEGLSWFEATEQDPDLSSQH